MKFKNLQILLSIIILAALIFQSCNRESEKAPELLFKTYKYSEEIHLFDNDNYPACQIDVRINLPTDSLYYSDLRETLLINFFDSIYNPELSIDDMLLQAASDLSKDYLELEEFYKIDSAEMGNTFNWELIIQNEDYQSIGQYVTFMTEFYGYTGGAHGNTGRVFYVYDLNNKNVLSPEEVFDLSKCEEIIELQKSSLAKIEELSNFWLDGLKCDENFYVIENGFVFHYDQYEIAPYAAGPIEIFLRFEDIESFLRKPELFKAIKKE